MIAGVLAASVGTASAADVVNVSPSSNLVSGQTITVAVTPDAGYGPGIFGAATQCGNADAAGNGLSLPLGANDCAGQANGFGAGLQLFSDAGLGFPGALAGGITVGTTYSITLQALKSGIGLNNRQCLPLGGSVTLPCTVSVAFADAGSVQYGSPTSIPITYRPPATVAISSVTGQLAGVTTAARSTDVINISGGNWDANGSLTASLCDVALTVCDAAGVTGSASTNGSGAASGALTVTNTATAGTRALKLTDGVQTASVAVQILGARSVTLSPAAGGIGTSVSVNGASYNASETIAIQALSAAFAPIGAPVLTSSSTVGAVNGTFPISDAATAYIAVAEATNNPAVNVAFAPFAFSANSCNGTGCTVLQTVTLVVSPGVINITQAGNAVGMSAITLDGTQQTSTGALQGVTITDARGTLNGWSVTAIMNNLSGPGGTNSTIPAGNMTVVTPACAPQSATTGSVTGITSGTTAQAFDPITSVSLCTASAGEGGGTYSVGSGLSLTVPATVRSGTYTSTITVLLT